MAKYNVSKSEAKKLGIKRVKVGSSKSSSKSDDIDYSKRKSGTSKREYYAQQLGGTLNKDTNEVTVKSKSTPQKASVQGPLMEDGRFYSKQSADSPENQAVYQYRQDAEDTQRQKAAKVGSGASSRIGGYKFPNNRAVDVRGASSSRPNAVPNQFENQRKSFGYNAVNQDNTMVGFAARQLLKLFGKNTQADEKNLNYNTAPQEDFSQSVLERDELLDNENRGETPLRDRFTNRTNPNEIKDLYGGNLPDDIYNFPSGQDGGNQGSSQQFSRPKSIQTGQEETYQSPEVIKTLIESFNPQIDYSNNAPVQPDTGNTGRQLASGGALGNGAGLANNQDPETEAYIKRLQASLSGDFGDESNDDALENLLNGINSRYDESKRLGEKTLGESKTSDMNKLASLFAAYNTSDSEQRVQTQQRTQNDYADQLTELIAQLSAGRNQEVTQAKTQWGDARSQIQQQKRSAESNVADLIYKAQNDIKNRNYERQQDAISNRLAQQKAVSSQGFTPTQQQNIQEEYNKDMQDMLGRAAYMPSGGREFVYNQLVNKYGSVLDEDSIKQDLFQGFAQPGWEGQYKSQYKNPAQKSALDEWISSQNN